MAGNLGPGLDTKADGGYIVAPPSWHISGHHYESLTDDDMPLADMPAWLVAIVSRETERPKIAALPESWRRLVAEGVTEGQRNDAVARLAGLLLRPGPKNPYVVLDLLRCWNELRCQPPLADAEVARTVESICSRELDRRQGRR